MAKRLRHLHLNIEALLNLISLMDDEDIKSKLKQLQTDLIAGRDVTDFELEGQRTESHYNIPLNIAISCFIQVALDRGLISQVYRKRRFHQVGVPIGRLIP